MLIGKKEFKVAIKNICTIDFLCESINDYIYMLKNYQYFFIS